MTSYEVFPMPEANVIADEYREAVEQPVAVQ
jgi:hypothetical protein